MSDYKSRSTAGFLLLCFASSCGTISTDFKEGETQRAAFYAPALRDTCGNISLKSSTADVVSGITVYKTAFREKLVETGSIINYASLNDASTREVVDYRPPRTGYRQDMYLVRVQASCHPDAWFYFSVWYRFDRNTMKMAPYGFGKAYMGRAHNAAGTIYFHTALSVKEGPSGFGLSPSGKSQFYFVLDQLPADTLRVNRIVMEEKNKFGGPRSYVFKVEKHFPNDLQRLSFQKQASQHF